MVALGIYNVQESGLLLAMKSIKNNVNWNGEPATARAVAVIVGKAPVDTWWCARLAGKEHRAIEITQNGQVFYINDDQQSRLKITEGMDSPRHGHKGLPVERVLEEAPGGVAE